MILYYVRHGDPIYNPNQLTPLGERQAEAVARRLAVHGIDKIFSSPSNRAHQTSMPLCQIMKQEAEILDWTDEDRAFEDLVLPLDTGKRQWVFRHPVGKIQFSKQEVRNLGRNWHTHPDFANTNFTKGIQRIQKETDAFLESLGYRHDLENNCYYAERENNDRIALFAHEGVGMAILSCMLDIPYPIFSTHFDMTHTGVTVIHFESKDGIVLPKVLTFSNDSHFYRDGLPTKHQNKIYY
jgi:probable phosphoglycerate mutase